VVFINLCLLSLNHVKSYDFYMLADESLFSFIPLVFVYPFDSCSMLNYLFLVCFHLLGFIGPLFQIWVNFTLFGPIFIFFNYF